MFLLESAGAPIGCNSNNISIKSAYGKYVVAEQDGSANANRDAQYRWEMWSVEQKGNDTFALGSYHGKYLVAENINGEVNAGGSSASIWETYAVEQLGNDIAFKTHHNTYLSADSAGNLNARSELGHDERFSIQCLGG